MCACKYIINIVYSLQLGIHENHVHRRPYTFGSSKTVPLFFGKRSGYCFACFFSLCPITTNLYLVICCLCSIFLVLIHSAPNPDYSQSDFARHAAEKSQTLWKLLNASAEVTTTTTTTATVTSATVGSPVLGHQTGRKGRKDSLSGLNFLLVATWFWGSWLGSYETQVIPRRKWSFFRDGSDPFAFFPFAFLTVATSCSLCFLA